MSVVLFAATDGVNGTELWSTDGTTGHTGLVKDIRAGTTSSQPYDLTLFAGEIFFTVYDETGSPHLWKTDGSAAGTVAVTTGNFGYGVDSLFAANGKLFFAGSEQMPDGTFGSAIFATDGTSAGTVALTTGLFRGAFYATTNAVFFQTNDGSLWATNGTKAGTRQVLVPNGSLGDVQQSFASAGSQLFFEAQDAAGNYALWASDGTAAGTRIVIDNSYCFNMLAVGDKVFFSRDTTNVWVSDGTAAGTFQVSSSTNTNSPTSFTSFGGKLYFLATDQAGSSSALYVSDGTIAGTQVVRDAQGAGQLTRAGSNLYFFGYDPAKTSQAGIWVSDGTSAGTRFVADVPDSTYHLIPVGSKVFFVLNDQVNGEELWVSDGTAAGTGLVKDINPGGASSNPANITDFNGRAIFTATTASGGTEVWISDGTAAGTMLLRDIYGGTSNGNPNSSNPYGFTVLPGGTAIIGFDNSATFTDGSTVKFTGTVTDGDTISSVKVYDGSTYLGTATFDTATNTWTLTITLSSGSYTSLKVVVTDVNGTTATANATFQLQTGITGQNYVAIESDYNGSTLVDRTYYRSNGSLYETATYAADGTRSEVYVGITGQSYTSYELDYSSSNVLIERVESGYTGRSYVKIIYDYNSTGSRVTRKTYLRSDSSIYERIVYTSTGRVESFYGVTGRTYTSYQLYYSKSNVLTERIESGYSGQRYVSIRYDYDSSGTNVVERTYLRSDNSIYETITYSSSGQVRTFYGITGQGYTSYSLTYTSSNTLTTRREYGYTNQAYVTIEYDYDSAGTSVVEQQYFRADASLYETIVFSSSGQVQTFYGITGKPYTTAEYDFDANGRNTQQIFYRSDNSLYEKVVFNADGTQVQSFYGVTGQAYTSYDVYFDASGTATLEKLYGFSGQIYVEEDIALDSSGSPSGYTFYRADHSLYATIAYTSTGTTRTFTIADADFTSSQTLTYDISSSNHAGDRLVFDASREKSASFIVTGTAGNDRITTGGGNDILKGGGGSDVMTGGAGNDAYYIDRAADRVVEASGGGTDTVYAAASYTLGANLENLYAAGGANGTTAVNLTGNVAANKITGNAASNIITGAGGTDTLTGGGGADTFVYHAGWGLDTIKDFTAGSAAGHDRIQIDKSLFADYASLMAHTVDGSAGAAVVTLDAGDTITLTGATKESLVAADFVFK